MKKLSARDLKDIGLLKHYRIIRKWACKNNELNDADLELLIYFDCMDHFTKQLISRMYRIMLGEDDIPASERRNKIISGNSYTSKVLTQAIYNVNRDKTR